MRFVFGFVGLEKAGRDVSEVVVVEGVDFVVLDLQAHPLAKWMSHHSSGWDVAVLLSWCAVGGILGCVVKEGVDVDTVPSNPSPFLSLFPRFPNEVGTM